MDETSLSNDEVIALLNAFFIPVRVEESQRPDVDLRYNQGGWPTIAFLAPDGGHLQSINYAEPGEFIDLLVRLVDFCRKNDAPTLETSQSARPERPSTVPPLNGAIVEEVAGILEGLADPEFGGFGVDLKLLHPTATEFLFYRFEVTGERWWLDHAVLTLDSLRDSPTFDAKDGGFYRYSSRRDWREPHPEKLLADQAALLRNYLHAYLLTGEDRFRDTATGLVDYLLETLSDAAVAPFFLGCQDYVRDGAGELRSYLDTYVYCDANAQAASALLEAWWLLGRDECRSRALAVVEGIWQRLRTPDGGMYHYWDDEPRAPGLLVDLVATGLLLLDAYAFTADRRFLERAATLAECVVARHTNSDGGFFDISETGAANLAYRLTPLSQNIAAASFFLRLADLGGAAAGRRWADWALRPFTASHREHGAFAAGFGQAVGRLLVPPVSLTLAGAPGSADSLALLRAALALGHPNLVLCYKPHTGAATVELRAGDRALGTFADPAALRPDILGIRWDRSEG